MIRVDAHQHFWRLARGDYRWPTPELAPLWRDFEPSDLLPHLARTVMARTVLVQATDTLDETRYLLELARKYAFVAGVVGWVDLAGADVERDLDSLASAGPLVGVRPMLQDIADDAWVLRGDVADGLRAVELRGLAFDALIRPRHLPHIRELARRHPALRVVVDHAAKPEIALDWSGFGAWRAGMVELAREPNTVVKLSGLVTETRGAWSNDVAARYRDVLLESFGPERIAWGSDWPVVELAGGYAHWFRATLELTAQLAAGERAAILGETAERVYRLEKPKVQSA